MKRNFFLLLSYLSWLVTVGQPLQRVIFYDEEDGLPHGHVTQLLQDELGFMWFATWNGLCRYDGYEFHTFKSQVGDGCHMTTDRFRDIALRPDGKIVCRVDDSYYLFDTHTYRFTNMTAKEASHAADDLKRYRMSQARKDDDRQRGFGYTDRQGNRWTLGAVGINKEILIEQNTERLDIEPKAEVKCLFTDHRQRYWVATKDDAALRVYSADGDRLLGYLAPDGHLRQAYTRFGAAVYCMYEAADGTLWLGTKPDGLFRLTETTTGIFKVEHFTDLPHSNVYAITQDSIGRLWLATLGGGLCYTDEPKAKIPHFRVPKNYPENVFQRARFLTTAENGQVLMATTTDGLLIAKLEENADDMQFHQHQRESDRAKSLSSSATMDMIQDVHGNYYISTESGGINRIEGHDLLAGQLSFRHYNAAAHLLPSDVVLSMTKMDNNWTMVVSSHLVSLLDSAGHYRVLDARFTGSDYRFSDARPQRLSGDRWLFGLTDGAFVTSTHKMFRQVYQPPLVLTGVSVQGANDRWAVAYADTILLGPHERSLTIRFAALEYSAPERISYAFRLLPSKQWNYIGHDRSATLLDLSPGTCQLEIRSTNADGQWAGNIRRLTIVVQPTFWESAFGRLLIVLLVVGFLAAAVFTLLYIRQIKRKQHETLEKYLALIEKNGEGIISGDKQEENREEREIDPILQRVMQFVEENIANSEAGVGDMATAAAISRSGLQRKLKQAMGITPQDLLHEARIKRACQLLRETNKTVAEVAYSCGFTDPKYFSRSFKQSIGQSPTEYKNS